MEPPVERVYISQAAEDRLIKLKRLTKIDQWNVICRWALCRSLAEPSLPSPTPLPPNSNIEMSWQVFGGATGDQLIVALKQGCHSDSLGTERETLATQFRLHLHRGIGYLAADPAIGGIEDLVEIAAG